MTISPILSVIIPCYCEENNVIPLVRALDKVLSDITWEIIFVDDNSPDGTIHTVRRIAEQDRRVRGILRLGRRGLSSAVTEGILSSSATFVAVMDGDLQHDESCLIPMMAAVRDDHYDLAVASRHVKGGNSAGLSGFWRHSISCLGNLVAMSALAPIKDPMSGFFLMRQRDFEELAPRLTGHGFKILFEILMTSPKSLRIKECPMIFRERVHGESKMTPKIIGQFFLAL
ncbi:polyprenol monophosphomannose synthase, partial [Gluconobacter aidae]